jgi:AcrR family transcriptional regulator
MARPPARSADAAPAATPARRGRPPRTIAQRAAQRAALVEGAIQAIRTGGPEQSLEDMAAAIGVSKPVLYDEFGGRHGLADALAVVLAERVEQTVVARLTGVGSFDVGRAIHAVVDALVDLIEDEPQLYTFLVRSVRTSDRGFLDNALVRVIHERTSVLLGGITQGIDEDELALLVDGVYGFVFASVESWQATQRPSRERMVGIVASMIELGLRALSASRSTPQRSTPRRSAPTRP